MKRLILLFALTLALLPGCASLSGGGPSGAQGGEALARIVRTGEMRVGMSGDQPPFNMRSKEGELFGLEVALVNVLAANLGVRAELVELPFAGLLDALEAGEVDIVMSGMAITPERNLRAVFAGPYFVSGKSILTRKTTLARVQSAKELNQPNVRYAALLGSTSERFVRRNLSAAKLVTSQTPEEAVQMLLADRVDAVVADRETCVVATLRHPELQTLSRPLTVEPIGIALPPGETLLQNMLENYFDALENTGALEKARSFWFKDPSWLQSLP